MNRVVYGPTVGFSKTLKGASISFEHLIKSSFIECKVSPANFSIVASPSLLEMVSDRQL